MLRLALLFFVPKIATARIDDDFKFLKDMKCPACGAFCLLPGILSLAGIASVRALRNRRRLPHHDKNLVMELVAAPIF